jgi:hypothetical protein
MPLYYGIAKADYVKSGIVAKTGKPYVNFSLVITLDEINDNGYPKRDFVRGVAWDNAKDLLEYLKSPENLLIVDGVYGDHEYEYQGEKKKSKEFLGDHAIYILGYNALGEPALIHVSGKQPNGNPLPTEAPPAKGVTVPPAQPTPVPESAPVAVATKPTNLGVNPMPSTTKLFDDLISIIEEDEDSRLDMLEQVRQAWYPNRPGNSFAKLLTLGQNTYLIEHFVDEIIPILQTGKMNDTRDELILRAKGVANHYLNAYGGKDAPKPEGYVSVATLRDHVTGLSGKFDEQLAQLTDMQLLALIAAFKYAPTPVVA